MAKNSVKCRLVREFSRIANDYKILTVQRDGFVFGVLYRPPSGNKSKCLAFLDAYSCLVGDTGNTPFLAGDFNIDLKNRQKISLNYVKLFNQI